MKIKQTEIKHIDGIELVEFDRYDTLYSENPEKKKKFRKIIERRLAVAQEWMWVLVEDDKVLGALSAQPTNKGLDDFVSWEVSTNYGTLEGTYDEKGKNVYVVNLDAIREATKKGGQYMLMAYLAAKVVETNKNTVFFESRMPGFRDWLNETKNITSNNWSGFSPDKKQKLAEEYAASKTEKNGKMIPSDRLIKFYELSGFKQYKVLADAFEDPESLNFGVIFYANNPLPRIFRLFGVRNILASLIRIFSKNPKVLDLLV